MFSGELKRLLKNFTNILVVWSICRQFRLIDSESTLADESFYITLMSTFNNVFDFSNLLVCGKNVWYFLSVCKFWNDEETEKWGRKTTSMTDVAEKLSMKYFVKLMTKYGVILPKNKDDKNNNNNQSKKEIEASYFELMKQRSCCQHLLFVLNCKFKSNQKQFGVEDRLIDDYPCVTCEDDLYFDFSKCTFNNNDNNNDSKENDAVSTRALAVTNYDVLGNIVDGVINLLKCKLPINDELIILCLTFLSECEISLKMKNKQIDFIKTIQNCCKECLNEKFMNNDTKSRDYQYFKHFLLKSNLWLMPNPIENSKMMYDCIQDIVNNALLDQKQFIWDNVKKESSSDSSTVWDELLNKPDYFDPNLNDLRQDLIVNGIKPEFDEDELFAIAAKMDSSNNFDLFNESNTKSYLTKLFIFAHSVNEKFHSDCRTIFREFISESQVKYAQAPVKLEARCLVKGQTGVCLAVLLCCIVVVLIVV